MQRIISYHIQPEICCKNLIFLILKKIRYFNVICEQRLQCRLSLWEQLQNRYEQCRWSFQPVGLFCCRHTINLRTVALQNASIEELNEQERKRTDRSIEKMTFLSFFRVLIYYQSESERTWKVGNCIWALAIRPIYIGAAVLAGWNARSNRQVILILLFIW